MTLYLLKGPDFGAKKKFITEKYLSLLESSRSSEKNLVLSNSPFTSAAIKDSLQQKMDSYTELWVESVSSFCKKILRTYSSEACIRPGFNLINDFQKKMMIRNILSENRDMKYFWLSQKRESFVSEISNFIDIAKKNSIFSEAGFPYEKPLSLKLADIRSVYEKYEKKLKKYNYLDLSDMTLKTKTLLENAPDLFEYKSCFFIESEDMDTVMTVIVKKLINHADDSYISFEPEEAIYTFRGSAINDMQSFLDTSVSKTIEFRDERSPLQYIIDVHSYNDQLDSVSRDISIKLKDGVNPGEIAVLSRSMGKKSILLGEVMEKYGVNHVLTGGIGFFRHYEIRDLLAVLNCIDGQNLSEKNNILTAIRLSGSISQDELDIIRNKAVLSGTSIIQAFESESPEISARFWENMREMKKKSESLKPDNFIFEIMKEYGFFTRALSDKILSQIISYFFRIITEYSEYYEKYHMKSLTFTELMKNLFEILSAYGKDMDIPSDPASEPVKIMTVQQAKNMLFKYAYILDLTDEDFPRRFEENPLLSSAERKIIGINPLMDIDEHSAMENSIFRSACRTAEKELLFCTYQTDADSNQKDRSPFLKEKDAVEKKIPGIITRDDYLIELFCRGLKPADINADKEIVEIADKIFAYDSDRLSDRIISGLPEVYSSTMLETFVNCPAKFFLKYVLGIKEPGNVYSRSGIFFHRLLENLHSYADPHSVDIDGLIEKCSDNTLMPGFEARNLKFQAADIIDRYLEELRESQSFTVKDIEKDFSYTRFAIRFKGRIDRIDLMENGELRLVDYKTSRNAVKMQRAILSAMSKGLNFQVPVYHNAVESRYFSIYWLRKANNNIEAVIDFEDNEALAALTESDEHLKNTVSIINAGIFDKNCSNCRNCYFRNTC